MKNSKWLALLLVFVLVSALMPSALAADARARVRAALLARLGAF